MSNKIFRKKKRIEFFPRGKVILKPETLKASICDLEPIELPVEEENQNAMSIDIYHPEKGMEIEMDDCWEDDDQRLFYTDFPDLKSIVPMVAWKDSEKVRGGKFKKRDDKEKRE